MSEQLYFLANQMITHYFEFLSDGADETIKWLFFRSNISLILFPGFEGCLEAYYNSYRYSSKLTQAGICSKVPVNSIFKQRICLIVLTRFIDLLLERITTEHLICLKRNVRSFHSYQAYNSHVFFPFFWAYLLPYAVDEYFNCKICLL